MPDTAPLIAVASSGPASARIAAELGDGLFATEPKSDIVQSYRNASGDGPGYAEVPGRLGAGRGPSSAGRPVDQSLGGDRLEGDERAAEPINFDAATATVREEDVRGQFACGANPDRYVEVAEQFGEGGFDRLVMQNAGPDPDGFVDFYRQELTGRLRQLAA